MRKLHVYADELGDEGPYSEHSPIYSLSLLFVDESADNRGKNLRPLKGAIRKYGGDHFIHCGNLIRGEEPPSGPCGRFVILAIESFESLCRVHGYIARGTLMKVAASFIQLAMWERVTSNGQSRAPMPQRKGKGATPMRPCSRVSTFNAL